VPLRREVLGFKVEWKGKIGRRKKMERRREEGRVAEGRLN
jgi:hypothetical protein